MMKKILVVALAAAVPALAAAPASAAGDAAKGEKVFRKCKACHAVDGKNKVGPHLDGVFGRAAGTVEGFNYSQAMKDSGITWDAESLAKYLENPKDFVKGTKMIFAGLKKEDERNDVIAYLQSVTK